MNLITKLKQFLESYHTSKSGKMEVSQEVLNKLQNITFDHFDYYPYDENMTEAELFSYDDEKFALIAAPCFLNTKTGEAYTPKSPDEIIICLRKLTNNKVLELRSNLEEFKWKCWDLLSWQEAVYKCEQAKNKNKNIKRYMEYINSRTKDILAKSSAGFVDVI